MASPRRTSRLVALLLAVVQLSAPSLVAAADGLVQHAAAGVESTHVEAHTSATCPAVHSPDCAMCRYVSLSAHTSAPTLAPIVVNDAGQQGRAACVGQGHAVHDTPRGRSPPVI